MISEYGESYSRPLYITIGALIFGMFYFASLEFTDVAKIGVCDVDMCHLSEGIIRSINGILPFGKNVENPTWLDHVLKFIIFPIGGTSFIAIKRKFERKIRH